MELTADFVRALLGLSAAELTDDALVALHVLDIAEDAAQNYPDLTPEEALYYKGYKAITVLAPSLYLLVPSKVRDNFNEFSRFDSIQDALDYAFARVAAVEGAEDVELFKVVSPEYDPVTQEI